MIKSRKGRGDSKGSSWSGYGQGQTESEVSAGWSKESKRLIELMAAMYPGVKVGHKHCVERRTLVPKTMGWLWNAQDTATGEKLPRGWRPGAISLGVMKRLNKLGSVTEMSPTTPAGSKGRKIKRKIKTTSSVAAKSGSYTESEYIEAQLPPTLRVRKDRGIYRVTMQPIDTDSRHSVGEDHEQKQPVQFKIADSSSNSGLKSHGSSSSSFKIEYTCTGALRKPAENKVFAEIGTQWEAPADLSKSEQNVVGDQAEPSKRKIRGSKSKKKL